MPHVIGCESLQVHAFSGFVAKANTTIKCMKGDDLSGIITSPNACDIPPFFLLFY
jgi:hypothetical protein